MRFHFTGCLFFAYIWVGQSVNDAIAAAAKLPTRDGAFGKNMVKTLANAHDI